MADDRFEATVNVAKPEEAMKEARKWNLRANQATVGSPRDVTFEGNYGDLMNFLTEYLSMSSSEADTYVTEMGGGKLSKAERDLLNGPDVPEPVGVNPLDPKSYKHESTGFDKFMDRIVLTERRTQKVDAPEDNPQRRRAAKHQDRPMNKTRFGAKR